MKTNDLESFLHAQIPIAKALQARVGRVDHELAEIHAPLEPNRNHMGTAFGGSLNAILLLSCYAWLFAELKARGLSIHVLIKNGHTKYMRPVDGDFTAVCRAPSDADWQRFLRVLGSGRPQAQISLQASIAVGGEVACQFEGEFVARVSVAAP